MYLTHIVIIISKYTNFARKEGTAHWCVMWKRAIQKRMGLQHPKCNIKQPEHHVRDVSHTHLFYFDSMQAMWEFPKLICVKYLSYNFAQDICFYKMLKTWF